MLRFARLDRLFRLSEHTLRAAQPLEIFAEQEPFMPSSLQRLSRLVLAPHYKREPIHRTLRVRAAMVAGTADQVWCLEEVMALIAQACRGQLTGSARP